MSILTDFTQPIVERISATDSFSPELKAVEEGIVVSSDGGVLHIEGLGSVGYMERVSLITENGESVPGVIVDIDETGVSAALLDRRDDVGAGARVRRSGDVLSVRVGEGLLGRIVDALGRPIDGKGPVAASGELPMERESAAVMDRQAVAVPLSTGICAIDAMIPVGRGQRELIVGDRQTGKTAIAVDTIINQNATGVVAVYCAIGIPLTTVAEVVADLTAAGAMSHTVVVVASGDDSVGLNFVTPFAATSIGEWFMEQGRDVVVVYDDLTHHARSYRELALLLRRPPAREAFPGDIFYLHSRLLERATHLCAERGGGSLTALPIAETEAQNIAAYIPTNLISITDGQIYLSPKLAAQGQLPAIDVMRSVSRVGAQAQLAAFHGVAGELRLSYAQFEELETFSRFDTALDESTRATLERGRRVRRILRQKQLAPMRPSQEIALLYAVTAGLLDAVSIDMIGEISENISRAMIERHTDLSMAIESGNALTDAMKDELGICIRSITAPMQNSKADAI